MHPSVQELEILARQVNQAHRSAVQAELNAVGLGEVGHPLLLTILQSSCVQDPEGQCHAQRDLAQLLHLSPAAVATSLKSLEKSGYIRREPGRDARRNRVILTEKGQEAVTGCQNAFTAVSQRMLSGFSPEEREQLLSFRRRMLHNLREGSPSPTQAKEEC